MLLPPHPYRISLVFTRHQRRLAFLSLACSLMCLGATYFGLVEARRIAADRRIWGAGVETRAVEWRGTALDSKGFVSYDLDVHFRDAQATEHTGKVKFETCFGWVDTTVAPTVRYLAGQPDAFVLSTAIDLVPARWRFVAFMVAGIGGLGLFIGLLGLRQWQAIGAARVCALRAEEVELTVVSTRGAGRDLRQFKLRGTTPWRITLKSVLVEDRRLGGPLFLDRGRTKVLALVCHEFPSLPVVIRENLLPYEFSPSETASIRERLADGQLRRPPEVS